jgi:hypothetical protein
MLYTYIALSYSVFKSRRGEALRFRCGSSYARCGISHNISFKPLQELYETDISYTLPQKLELW